MKGMGIFQFFMDKCGLWKGFHHAMAVVEVITAPPRWAAGVLHTLWHHPPQRPSVANGAAAPSHPDRAPLGHHPSGASAGLPLHEGTRSPTHTTTRGESPQLQGGSPRAPGGNIRLSRSESDGSMGSSLDGEGFDAAWDSFFGDEAPPSGSDSEAVSPR